MKQLTKKITWISIVIFIAILLIGMPFIFVEGSGVLSGSFTYVGLVI